MNKFRKFLRQPRYFLSIFALPLILGLPDCPAIFDAPPPPTLKCQNPTISMNARKCLVIEPPCGIANWSLSNTITLRQAGFAADLITSDDTIMRRFCQSPIDSASITNEEVDFDYTRQGVSGEGMYNVNIFNNIVLTASISAYIHTGNTYPITYLQPDFNGNITLQTEPGGGTPPYTYQWFANGQTLPGEDGVFLFDSPSRNTEYSLIVTDSNLLQRSASMVVFVNNNPNDPTASFALPGIVEQGQQITLDSSDSSGDIFIWSWDFDWRGEISESFDSVIKGPDGTVQHTFNAPGRKYVRLRVRTLSGNIHEIFRAVTVTTASG